MPGEGFRIASAYVDISARDQTASGVSSARRSTDGLRDRVVRLTARDDTSAGVAGARRSMSSLGDKLLQISARDNTGAAVSNARRSLSALHDKTVQIDADTARAQVELDKVNARLNELRAKKTSPKVDLEIREAQAKAQQIQARLQMLRDKRVNVHVDTSGATGSLGRLNSSIGHVSNRGMLIGGLIAAGLGVIGPAVAAAAGSLASLASIGGVLFGSFSGIGDALKGYTADQDAATAATGKSSSAAAANARAIRNAAQAVSDARRSQAQVARDTAQSVADAQDAVNDANRNAARVARDSSQAVQDALRAEQRVARDTAESIADARENQNAVAARGAEQIQAASERVRDALRDEARVAEDVADSVADARRRQADVSARGAEQMEQASRRVQDALDRERDAQEDLTTARRDAAEQLDDLRERVSDFALDEEGAAIRVERAKEKLQKTRADETSSALDLRDAQHDLAVAEERLQDIREERAEQTARLNQAERAGINGAERVIDAQDRVRDAEQALADARREQGKTAAEVARANQDAAKAVAEAVRDGAEKQARAEEAVRHARKAQAKATAEAAKANREAAEDVAEAVRDAAEQQQDAARAVARAHQSAADANADASERQRDATQALARAQQDAAEAQEDAAIQVSRALQGLSDAQASAAESAGGAAGAASKYAEAMAKLSPEAQALVRQLIAMGPAFQRLKDAAGREFLPGVTQMLKDSEGLFPIFEENLLRTGKIMGDTAREFGEMFKSDEFKTNLDQMFKNAEPITRAIGGLFVGLTGEIVKLGANTGQTQQGFADFITSMETGLAGFFEKISTPEADRAFGQLWRELGGFLEFLLPLLGDFTVWAAEKLGPAIGALTGFLERNRDKLDEWALMIFGGIAAIKGLKLAMAGWNFAQAVGQLLGVGRAAGTMADGMRGKGRRAGSNFLGGMKGALGAAAIAGVVANIAGSFAEKDWNELGATSGDRILSGMQSNFNKFVTGDWGSLLDDMFEQARGTAARIAGINVKFAVGADTAVAEGNISLFLAATRESSTRVKIGADTLPAGEALRQVITAIEEGHGEVDINGQKMPAEQALAEIVAEMNESHGTVDIGGNKVPAGDALLGFINQANGTTTMVKIDADPRKADGKLETTIWKADGSTGTITLDGNPVPVNNKTYQAVTFANGETGTITIDGNQKPSDGKVQATVRYADGSTGTITVRASNAPAVGTLNTTTGRINGSTGTVGINANNRNAFQRLWDFLGAIPVRKTIELAARKVGDWFGFAGGGPITGFRLGGPIRGFASGGAITGPGTGTSDSILARAGSTPIRLSNGEHVWTAREVQAAGGHAAVMAMRQATLAGGVQAFATGGAIAGSTAPTVGVTGGGRDTLPRALKRLTAFQGDVAEVWGDVSDVTAATWGQVQSTVAQRTADSTTAAVTNASLLASGVAGWWARTFNDTTTRFNQTRTAVSNQMSGANVAANTEAQRLQVGLADRWARTLANSTDSFNRTRTVVTNQMVGASTAANSEAQRLQVGLAGQWARTLANSTDSFNRTRATVSQQMAVTNQNSNTEAYRLQTGLAGHWSRTLANSTDSFNRTRAAISNNMYATRDNSTRTAVDMRNRVSQAWMDLERSSNATFARTVDNARRKWAELRGAVDSPVRFVVHDVWNRGIGSLWGSAGRIFPLPGFPAARYATGGDVHGPGTGTSDSIPAMLSNGEHVWTAQEVRAAGGHGVVESLRNTAKAGGLKYAAGGPVSWQDMWSIIRPAFPAARLTSSFRRGDSGYHGRGKAVDLAGPRSMDMPYMLKMNQWIASKFPQSAELIHTPGVNLKNGRPHTYNAGVRAGHYNHVHWANNGGEGFAGGGFFGPSYVELLNQAIAGPIDALRKRVHSVWPGNGTLTGDIPKKFTEWSIRGTKNTLTGKAKELDATAGAAMAGSGPAQDQVRAVANRYGWGAGPQWDAIVRLVQKESSWNPAAANPTSSARGLFQKMTSIHGPVEPTAAGQAEWGLNYIRGRYGDPVRALNFHNRNNWYDDGGLAKGAGYLPKKTVAPERVLSPQQTLAFERLVDVLDRQTGQRSRGHDGDLHVHVEQTTGSPAETARMVSLALRGVG